MKYYFLALATGVVVCVGCVTNNPSSLMDRSPGYAAPPAAIMQRPGPMVDGPGPGVIPAMAQTSARAFITKTTQLRFVAPKAMKIGWQVAGGFAESQLVAPGSYNFRQGASYRLKLSGIPGRKLTLYPTLQVYPSHPTTDAYLAHNSIPIGLTDEDLDQIENSNYVTKVIYLPDAKYQDLVADVDTLVSTRLEPGVDPVAEADRRGTVMVVIRIGNKDLEMGSDAPALPEGGAALDRGVNQVSYRVLDGNKGEHAAPMPIAAVGGGFAGVPGPMIVAGSGVPGRPGMNPVSGVGGVPVWGSPTSSTPIGLPGPPQLPLGGPAGLRSHTVVNNTKVDIGRPVDHMLIEVEHQPGYRLPKPVKYIRYTERHPHYQPRDLAQPNFGGTP
ncbi:MAG: hypothetical protein ACE5KM_10960 [Planctomycetaceae bacterium]